MSEGHSPEIDQSFLDDFFGEADEHLVEIRKALLGLEDSVGKAQANPQFVEALFRHFHSFKGIAAIVGLEPAEGLAHASEDFLRLLKGGKRSLAKADLELVVSSAHKLEQIVAAFRAKKPLPGYKSLLAEIKRQCANPSASPAAEEHGSLRTGPSASTVNTSVEEAKAHGRQVLNFTFSPSPELNARGINVNFIREKLSALGEILKSNPVVKGPGKIEFEFLVSTPEPPANLGEWQERGVSVQAVDQADSSPDGGSGGAAESDDESAHNPFLAPSHVVRVDLQRLDDLMRITGEMVIYRSRLETQLGGRSSRDFDLRNIQEVSGRLGRSLRELREAIMRVRLVPVAEIFARMPFVVRDLSRQTSKKVRLKLEGQDTAIDKYIMERLKDPLLHLVRNAFSHGVETAEERAKLSKPEEATITLKALAAGDSVIIEVSDDGRGVNADAVLARAKRQGMQVPDSATSGDILEILCSSGFSTRDDADRAAGRGVGMAVVNSTVRELGGSLTLESEEGRGTRFVLRLPLTMAIAEMFIVTAAGQTCAVPQNVVREIIHVSLESLRSANGVEVVPYQTGILPVIGLADIFRLPRPAVPKLYMLVITTERGSVGLLVEKVLGQREVVVRALRDPLIQVSGITGATELGDGKPVLILDPAVLTAGHVRPPESGARLEPELKSSTP